MAYPILYSFRRCPYAMRARLGLFLAGQEVELREIVLKHKPEPMLAASPKGTVPVLILEDGSVIDESLSIMLWALGKKAKEGDQKGDDKTAALLLSLEPDLQQAAMALITENDNEFKPWLDKYKYADRHPEQTQEDYRAQGERFIARLEARLNEHAQLMADVTTVADYAIFPFVRQFAHVDNTWWQHAPYPKVRAWLANHIDSPAFTAIMKKYPTWLDSGESFSLLEN
ncbi:glutathione S-transferase [Shewanella alkalitolerans]|uniref:glutathione S-transferase n=1 Tax=Shewanella alkalitolerans TaxID=2864209 RepID=UPI001C65FA44|nr:glutathione S-transferase [Shewanella alkalitolerans]QYJ99313.1 glutathione S-transferase [Shewanella alkalitolerans]